MSGFVSGMATCYVCGSVFQFNVNKVPSIRVEGVREPLCRSCVEKANPVRVEAGLEPIVIQPGAYEPAPEEEVNWEDEG